MPCVDLLRNWKQFISVGTEGVWGKCHDINLGKKGR